jgi:hypothetical protein
VPGGCTPAAGDAWLTRQRSHLASRRACPLAVVARSTGEGREHVVGFAPSPEGNRAERIGGRDREMLSFLMELSPPAAGSRLVPHDR